jgi:hypothetical protein
MQQKFNVGIVTFSYGGNGGISSEVPDIREWMVPLVANAAKDPRIEHIRIWNLADTPITMTRNRAVLQARQAGVDVLVMVDSDMKPDMDPGGQPFFQTSFDFLVNHYAKGPCVIGVPYCGPPPNECVYVFRWNNRESLHAGADFQLEMYDRHTAVSLGGIQECAALPTGLIMYDLRCFDLIEPKTAEDKPWFYYEWKDIYASDKASTEDVTNTRDISLVGIQKLGYNPVYCNWDAWAGHWKPKCVGKPVVIDAKGVSQKLRQAVETGVDSSQKLVCLPSCEVRGPAQGDRMADYVRLSDGTPEKLALLRSLMDQAPKGAFLEIGNREGGTLLMAMEHPNSIKVTGVDPYGGIPYQIPNGPITTEYDDAMYQRMLEVTSRSPCASKLTHKKMTSYQFMNLNAWKYAFVYLDGSHEPDVVRDEIECFSHCLITGGLLVVDDIDVLPDDLLEGWERQGKVAWRTSGALVNA